MRLFNIFKKQEAKKETISYNSFRHFHQKHLKDNIDDFFAVSRYLEKGYKLTEDDINYIVLCNVPFFPVNIQDKETFDISPNLEEKLLKAFILNDKYADVILSLLNTEKKERFSNAAYKIGAEIAIEYILSKENMVIENDLYAKFFTYCLDDKKFEFASKVSDECLVKLIKENLMEIYREIEPLTKVKLSKNVLFFLYNEHKQAFDKYCKEGGKIGNNTERIFISLKALPDEYFEKNWVFSENVNFLKEVSSIEKIETLFSKKFPETAEELFLFVDFICDNNFSQVFWKELIEKMYTYGNYKIIIDKIYANPKGLPKLIQAGYPIEEII